MKHVQLAAFSALLVSTVLAACAGITGGEPSIDRAFIDMMVPHHESAVAMAEIALERAEHPELRDLAQDIIDAQSAEIGQLKDWRAQWLGSSDTPSMDEMPMLPRMSMEGHAMSGATMDMAREVDGLRSAEPFERLFIDAMIRHHEQAVEAAQIVQEETGRAEIRQLAEAIIDGQTAEIEQLRQWREDWY